ncbi:MAG TPA: tRNA pseudouridine(55) synthase TruB [Solibacterales bacterium]|nr:tRNA pseudouridine(55) synthase TruB [Bryobacterales bacterium]
MDGLILLDKPAGWTSHDAVNKLRRLVQRQKVGHLGTLDPMATGVLPLLVGRATRLAQFFSGGEKVYRGVIRFGFATDTYDREGEPGGEAQAVTVSREALESLLDEFRGTILQTPPPISAKKIGGVPAYRLARKQQPVDLPPVEVTIHKLDLLSVSGPDAEICVHCAPGTYIRSLAHDLGLRLGCGAHLYSLRRLASSGFTIQEASTMERLMELATAGTIEEALLPAARLLPDFPSEVVDSATAAQIRQGRDFRISPFRAQHHSRYVKALDERGQLVAIGEARLPQLYHPTVVL